MKFAYYLTFLFTALVLHGMALEATDTEWVTWAFMAAVLLAYAVTLVSIRRERADKPKYPSTIREKLRRGVRDGASQA